jgi:hypothetical protein
MSLIMYRADDLSKDLTRNQRVFKISSSTISHFIVFQTCLDVELYYTL